MFGFYVLEAGSFPMGDRKGADPEKRGSGEELGGIEERVTIIRIYYMRK